MMNAKPRILVVDDDSSRLQTLRLLFSMSGYDVAVAQGGTLGLSLLQGASFDFVLSDLRMPDMSGLEFLAEARERVPQTPVMIFTAYGTTATESAAKSLGAIAYLDGLVDCDVLLGMVRDSLNKSSATRVGSVESIGPATRRWVAIVVMVAQSNADLPTLAHWARVAGKSVGTLKRQCELCGVRASVSLDFGRSLRIVMLHTGQRCNWYDVLDIAESATMIPFLERAGFKKNETVPDVPAFLQNQRFIDDTRLVEAVRAAAKIQQG